MDHGIVEDTLRVCNPWYERGPEKKIMSIMRLFKDTRLYNFGFLYLQLYEDRNFLLTTFFYSGRLSTR